MSGLVKNKPIYRWLLPVITLALLAYLFGLEGNREEMLARGTSGVWWMLTRWSGVGGGLAHVWVVPLISLYLVWRKRAELRAVSREIQPVGWWLCLACMGLYLIGMRVQQTRLVLLALVGLMWAGPLYLCGWKTARILVFPSVYLLFCIPVGFLDSLTLPLRHVATIASGVILNGVGVPVVRQGTALFGTGDLVLDVADPCSGLRYLLTLTAIAAPYAYLTQIRLRSQWLVFLSAFPLAVVGNVARIVVIALVARFWGAESAMGLYHNFSGYVVFVVAIGLMLLLGEGLERWDRQKLAHASPRPPDPVAPLPMSVPFRDPLFRAWVALIILLGITGLGVKVFMQKALPEPQAGIQAKIPERVGGVLGDSLRFCQRETCRRTWETNELPTNPASVCPACGGLLGDWALAEKVTLPADTEIDHRRYRIPGGPPLQVTLVLNGREQKSIHRPERCLPAQGFAVEHSQVRRIPRPGRPDLPVRLMILRPAGGTDQSRGGLLYAYWFIGPGHETASHFRRLAWMGWESLRDGVPARWAYVAVATEWPREPAPRDEARLDEFLKQLADGLIPEKGEHRPLQ
jgi:exosortase